MKKHNKNYQIKKNKTLKIELINNEYPVFTINKKFRLERYNIYDLDDNELNLMNEQYINEINIMQQKVKEQYFSEHYSVNKIMNRTFFDLIKIAISKVNKSEKHFLIYGCRNKVIKECNKCKKLSN